LYRYTEAPHDPRAHKDVDRVLRKEILVNDTHTHIYAMTAVGLYKLSTVDPQLAYAWFKTLEPMK
jgi:hypothetical protein